MKKSQNLRKKYYVLFPSSKNILASKKVIWKWLKMLFISYWKLFSFSKYLGFFLDFWLCRKNGHGLIRKIRLIFKTYGATIWLTNNYNYNMHMRSRHALNKLPGCLLNFLILWFYSRWGCLKEGGVYYIFVVLSFSWKIIF